MAQQIYDIQGLDSIPWWPPAAGWWIVLGLLVLAVTAGFLAVRHFLRYPPGSWRGEAQRALRELRRQRNRRTQKEIAAGLSELLRRIAIASSGRQRTAALTGEEWLLWLEQSDPNGFPWRRHGALLLELPYMPEGRDGAGDQLDGLILAALRMTARHRGGKRGGAEDV